MIEAEFGVPAATVQLTLAVTMVGFATGQLLVGPWSDRVGRRLPLVLATVVHVGASLGVAASPSIEWLMGFRVLQGLGAAAGAVVAMAVVRDLFSGIPMVRMFSRLALVSGVAPVLAPVIGSQLLLVMPWHGMFLVLAAYGVALLVAVALFVVETLPPERRRAAGTPPRQRYRALFSDRFRRRGAHRRHGRKRPLRLRLVLALPSGVYPRPAAVQAAFGVNALSMISARRPRPSLRRIGRSGCSPGETCWIASAATIVSLDSRASGC